jgi:general secretion pathway protein I
MWKKYLSEKGITLLEVMVAVAIAAIALVSFIALVSTSVSLEEYARRVMEATTLADNLMKEIEVSSFPESGFTEGLVDEADPGGYVFRRLVQDSPIQDVRVVHIEILWDAGKSSVGLGTCIAKKTQER